MSVYNLVEILPLVQEIQSEHTLYRGNFKLAPCDLDLSHDLQNLIIPSMSATESLCINLFEIFQLVQEI